MEESCGGVVECTALVLAESYAELDGQLTLFGILDEVRPGGTGEASFVVYAKFEGCEHAGGLERQARFIISDEEGNPLQESEEFPVLLDGSEEPVTIVVGFELEVESGTGDRILWVEAVVDEEVLSQTAVRIQEHYNV